jgi:hypothetical protein
MKKLLRSTFGTLVVAAFLAMTPLTYTRGGHGGGHGVKHAAAGHVKGGHAAFRGRGGVATILSTMRAVARATQGAHITRPAVVIGEVITDIHTMDILGTV